MFVGMAVQPGRNHGIDVGEAVREALWLMRANLKYLWASMGYHEGSFVTRSLQGMRGYPLDLWKLMDVDDLEFLESLFAQLLEEKRARRRMARAELRSTSDKQGVA